jgi:translation initiation factor 1A
MLGNGRLTAFCFDGKQRLCHIRGKLRKKVWINTGDIILIGLREYQDDKVSNAASVFARLGNCRLA